MGKVRSIGSEFYSYSDGSYRNTTTLFPSLRMLKLEQMYGLEEWKDAKELIRAGEVLTVFPSLDELPSGLQFCASLQYLKIEYCPNLKSIPDLGELFHSLINLKLINSPYHQILKLSRREGRLKTMVIEELDAFPILHHPSIRYSHASLKKLILHGSPTLNSVPDEIQLFTALEELLIQDFDGSEALPNWLGIPSSLQKLSFYFCKKLICLPILHLTNLKLCTLLFAPI